MIVSRTRPAWACPRPSHPPTTPCEEAASSIAQDTARAHARETESAAHGAEDTLTEDNTHNDAHRTQSHTHTCHLRPTRARHIETTTR